MPDAQQNLSPLPRVPAVRRPLPDAQAIVAFAVPEAAPPYDDVRTDAPKPPAAGSALDDSGAGQGPGVPAGLPASIAGSWPGQFAQALSEALAGSRPASQLTPWTTEQARNRIRQLGPLLAPREARGGHARGPADRQPRVRRVIVTSPVQGVLEMTVVVDLGPRCRAVAVRLERRSPPAVSQPEPDIRPLSAARDLSGAWLCTAVEAA
jgi:Family of unknown function (DUF6459)